MTPMEERFLRDIENHKLRVLRDEGVYRHIRFSKPDSSDQFFDLITWPNHLCYTGDMGTYVFSRLYDMFDFFRSENLARAGEKIPKINPGYWSEKTEAVCRDGVREYCPDLFKSKVLAWVDSFELTSAQMNDLQVQVLSYAEDGEEAARQAAYEFTITNDDGQEEEVFTDFFEVSCSKFTFRYLWGCYAIAWGIRQYENHKEWQNSFGL